MLPLVASLLAPSLPSLGVIATTTEEPQGESVFAVNLHPIAPHGGIAPHRRVAPHSRTSPHRRIARDRSARDKLCGAPYRRRTPHGGGRGEGHLAVIQRQSPRSLRVRDEISLPAHAVIRRGR